MKMEVTFPGGAQVDATFKGHTHHTDQPVKAGGENTGPSPFDMFLASIATCSGFYAHSFCRERELATEGLRITLEPIRDVERRRVGKIRMEVHLPAGFPAKYEKAILRSMEQCAVKRHIFEPPEFEVATVS